MTMKNRLILFILTLDAISIKASPFLHTYSDNTLHTIKDGLFFSSTVCHKSSITHFAPPNRITKNNEENHLKQRPLFKTVLNNNYNSLNTSTHIKSTPEDSNCLNNFLLNFDFQVNFSSEMSNIDAAYRYSVFAISIIPMYRIQRFEIGAGVHAELGIYNAMRLPVRSTMTTKSLGIAVNYNRAISSHLNYIIISRLYLHDYKYKTTSTRVTEKNDDGFSCLIGGGLTFAGRLGSISPVIYMNAVSKNDITNPLSALLLHTGILVNFKYNLNYKP